MIMITIGIILIIISIMQITGTAYSARFAFTTSLFGLVFILVEVILK